MPRRFVDLSVPLEMGIASDPPMALPKIEYFNHKQTADQILSFFPGLTADDLRVPVMITSNTTSAITVEVTEMMIELRK